ncbi:LysR family transcriptional regulator [Comamonas endophytica]|uniref:LysR family transcriptional regulator n=1 Tax=Comamonas endophytica TaxID=2949090 RepID=UPI003615E140
MFQRIVEAGSFTLAAAHLGIPRSTISKALLELEAHLGTPLLRRTTRSVTLTVEGAEYYRRVSGVTASLDEADETLRHMGTAAQGRLRIDVYSSFANHVLIPALGYFKAEFPGVQLAVGISDRPVNLVEEGVDCVIRAGALADSTMVAKTLFKDRLLTCASPAYLELHGVPKTPEELKEKHQLVGYFGAAAREVWPLRLQLGARTHVFSNFDFYSNDSAGQIGMMASGLGVGQTHALVARPLPQSGALVSVLEDWTRQTVPISVMYPSPKRLNHRTRVFVDWLVRYVRQYAK